MYVGEDIGWDGVSSSELRVEIELTPRRSSGNWREMIPSKDGLNGEDGAKPEKGGCTSWKAADASVSQETSVAPNRKAKTTDDDVNIPGIRSESGDGSFGGRGRSQDDFLL